MKAFCSSDPKFATDKISMSATSVPNLLLIQDPVSKLYIFVWGAPVFELTYEIQNQAVAQYQLLYFFAAIMNED